MNFSIMIDLIFVLSCCKDNICIVTNHVTKRFFFKKRTISSLLSHKKMCRCSDCGAFKHLLSTSDVCGAFGNMVAKTDDTAFGNEIARMISLCSIIESNSYLRFPKSKQMKSWFTFGYPEGNGQLMSPLSFSP